MTMVLDKASTIKCRYGIQWIRLSQLKPKSRMPFVSGTFEVWHGNHVMGSSFDISKHTQVFFLTSKHIKETKASWIKTWESEIVGESGSLWW